ncbi:MAG: para-nitrobenzyl esterase [Frankiales bacterium]|nr:para-nitrobenzyl esterase [Frankiales bacterium]
MRTRSSIQGRGIRALVALVASAGLLGSATLAQPAAAASKAKAAPSPLVKTGNGWLRGVSAGGADRFLGVPFAAAPVKGLRFHAPVPHSSWKGVRDATRQSPACLQFQPTGVRETQAVSEDCLYLDLYRPAGTKPGAKLPVLVWYHGGGWTQGTGVIYGGQTMATLTHSIVISTNYRLGALGFLALPQLDAESPSVGSGNYATLDQIQVLKWVRQNINAFGGDKRRVTIFGQSAGGGSVCTLLASPKAKGLFSRAIVESLGCSLGTHSLAAAETTGSNFAKAAGCGDPAMQVACLRKAWAPALIDAAQTYNVAGETYGTGLVPEQPTAAIAAGHWNKVPVMIGGVRSEGKLFIISNPDLTAAQYTAQITATYGANAAAVLAKYPLSAYPSPFYALAAVTTDSGIACAVNASANQFAGATPTYRYEFNDPTSPTLYGFQPPGIDMSNAHSAELAYLFNFTLGDRPLTAKEKKLSAQMMKYWAAFARTGNPHVKGLPAWPKYTAATQKTLVLRPTGNSVSSSIAAEHNCDFWATVSTG